MTKYAIGRPINGVYLNGLEYLLDEGGDVMTFDSMDECKKFVIDTFEVNSDDADDMIFEYDNGGRK